MNTNKLKLKKVLLTLVVQILISITLATLYVLIFKSVSNIWLVEKIISTVLFVLALHITLLILSKRFIPDDAKYLSVWLAIIYIGFYIPNFIYYHDIDNMVVGLIYAAISFFYTKWFIENKFKKKLAISNMSKKMKIILAIGIIVMFTLFIIIAYFSNSLVSLGLCKPGDKIGKGLPGPDFCYTPSGFAGNPCDKATDCGSGRCALVDSHKTTDNGICKDLSYGCNVWIDENGKFDVYYEICED